MTVASHSVNPNTRSRVLGFVSRLSWMSLYLAARVWALKAALPVDVFIQTNLLVLITSSSVILELVFQMQSGNTKLTEWTSQWFLTLQLLQWRHYCAWLCWIFPFTTRPLRNTQYSMAQTAPVWPVRNVLLSVGTCLSASALTLSLGVF